MRAWITFGLVAWLTALSMVDVHAQQRGNAEGGRRNALALYERAINGMSLEGALNVFEPDGIIMPNNGPTVAGRAALRDDYERTIFGPVTILAAQRAGIERVAWLQGCWESASSERTVEEQWMAPRGGSMLGMSRTVRAGRLAEYEVVVLREQGNQLAYEAHPSGQPPAVFLSRAVGESMVVFENPQHVFPQRVGYRKDGSDSLLAWIEGTRNGQVRRVAFPYRRAACPR